jgi:hypothetical protein
VKLNGQGLSGVTITLSGASSQTVQTGRDGKYTFTNLANGSYTVTPSRSGYGFYPFNRAVPVSGADVAGMDFISWDTTSRPYQVSGVVRYNGVGLSGVAVTLSGTSNATVTTGVNGGYRFTNLPVGVFIVTPSMTGYQFLPSSKPVVVKGVSVAGVNFTATK